MIFAKFLLFDSLILASSLNHGKQNVNCIALKICKDFSKVLIKSCDFAKFCNLSTKPFRKKSNKSQIVAFLCNCLQCRSVVLAKKSYLVSVFFFSHLVKHLPNINHTNLARHSHISDFGFFIRDSTRFLRKASINNAPPSLSPSNPP